MKNLKITSIELKATLSLAAVLSLRMLGMFMVLPVLTTYGMMLQGANKTLIGFAISIYGLMQAGFQILFGLLSDRIGRKPVIIIGLLIFVIGSIIAALSDSIWGIIFGRALQGSGAISSSVMALLSDLIQEQNRTKIMSFIGASFGITFAIAMILGPIITHAIGLKNLFWIIAILATIGILVILVAVPDIKNHIPNHESKIIKSCLKKVIFKSHLLKINFSIMCLHVLLISSFLAIPKQLESSGIFLSEHWKIYLVNMLVSFVSMVPCIIYAEKKHRIKHIFLSCIILMLFSEVIFYISDLDFWKIALGMQFFFLSFNLMEAILPTIVSKEAPISYKGTAMGIYSTSQFIGVAIGGFLGGWINRVFGIQAIFFVGILLTIFWFLISITIKESSYIKSLCIKIPNNIQINEKLKTCFEKKTGVEEVLIISEHRSIYIKINSKITNRFEIEKILKSLNIGLLQ